MIVMIEFLPVEEAEFKEIWEVTQSTSFSCRGDFLKLAQKMNPEIKTIDVSNFRDTDYERAKANFLEAVQ
jgi:hypothetical protein